jgi:hypothetical protein
MPRNDAKGGAHAAARMSNGISGLHGAKRAPGTIHGLTPRTFQVPDAT